MAAKGNSGLWKETTAISKEVSKEGQIAHIIPGWECVHCNLKVWKGMYHDLPFILLAMLVFAMLPMALLALSCDLKLW